MEIFQAILNAIVGVAWPLAIVTMALIFREDIRRKFGDIVKAGPEGVTFQQQVLQGPSEIKSGELTPLPIPNRSPFRAAIETSILKDLELVKDENRIPIVVAQLAIARIGRAFENIYANIFGSQIRGLQELRRWGGQVSLTEAEKFFEQIKVQYPDFYADATFSQWFQYLETNQLAGIKGANVMITDIGEDFLGFIADSKSGTTRSF